MLKRNSTHNTIIEDKVSTRVFLMYMDKYQHAQYWLEGNPQTMRTKIKLTSYKNDCHAQLFVSSHQSAYKPDVSELAWSTRTRFLHRMIKTMRQESKTLGPDSDATRATYAGLDSRGWWNSMPSTGFLQFPTHSNFSSSLPFGENLINVDQIYAIKKNKAWTEVAEIIGALNDYK